MVRNCLSCFISMGNYVFEYFGGSGLGGSEVRRFGGSGFGGLGFGGSGFGVCRREVIRAFVAAFKRGTIQFFVFCVFSGPRSISHR